MTASNPFLLHKQENVVVQNPAEGQWIFEVGASGLLQADFLQFDKDLSVRVVLADEGASCKINCAYLTNKNNKLNINIKVLHKAQNTTSEQVIKGIATEESAVSFNGTVEIPKDSQKCDGRQHHRGLVLGEKASISATPLLEIWADDVTCAHGSAIGPLDESQLFYLQTRGLNKSEAKKMLLNSFLSGILSADFDAAIQNWMGENV